MFKIFKKEGKKIYLVGGTVRDRLLNNLLGVTLYNSNDVDYATDANPQEIIQILEKNNLPVIPIGIDFGTVATIFNGIKTEITTFRCAESYKKGSRKPQVVFGNSIEEDLARRDFTINAIAMDSSGSLIDPFNGLEDIKKATIRTPLHPDISFQDDPLRMLRCCRFAAKLGFDIETCTFESIKKNAKEINNISVERIFEETNKLLCTQRPARGLAILLNSGLINEIFPELQKVYEFKKDQGIYHTKDVFGHILDVVQNCENKSEIRWAALFHDIGKPDTYIIKDNQPHFYDHQIIGAKIWNKIAERLKIGNDFKNHVDLLIYEHMAPMSLINKNVTDKALRRFINRLGNKLNDLLALYHADCSSHNLEKINERQLNFNQFKEKLDKLINTEDPRNLKLPSDLGLKIANALNIKPGPWLGKLMQQLRIKLIEGEININCNFIEEGIKIYNELESKEEDKLLQLSRRPY